MLTFEVTEFQLKPLESVEWSTYILLPNAIWFSSLIDVASCIIRPFTFYYHINSNRFTSRLCPEACSSFFPFSIWTPYRKFEFIQSIFISVNIKYGKAAMCNMERNAVMWIRFQYTRTSWILKTCCFEYFISYSLHYLNELCTESGGVALFARVPLF